MKHCECCTKKAQLKEKIDGDLLVMQQWLKNVAVHARALGTVKNAHKKVCIEIELERVDELITAIVNNGKYKKFTVFCISTDGQA